MNARLFRRRLPWLCGCHDLAVFGHLMPCAWWQTQPPARCYGQGGRDDSS